MDGQLRTQICSDLQEIAFQVFNCLELEVTFSNESYVSFSTTCHDGNNPTGLTYYFNTGFWTCWTRDCHSIYGPDLIGLIMAIKKFNLDEAHDWSTNLLKSGHKHTKKIKKVKKQPRINYWKEHNAQEVLPENWLARLGNPVAFCKNRGLDYSTVRALDCGQAKQGPLSGRFVIPVRNINGDLVGFTARKTYDNPHAPKWLHYPPGKFRKSLNLYNLHKVNESLQDNSLDSLIIVEGPLDVLKLQMAGVRNSVAIFGCKISKAQIMLIMKLPIVKVFLAMDGDKAGQAAVKENYKKLTSQLLDVDIITLEDGKDFGEMKVPEIQKVINESGVKI